MNAIIALLLLILVAQIVTAFVVVAKLESIDSAFVGIESDLHNIEDKLEWHSDR